MHTKTNGSSIEMAVVLDRKLSGKARVYCDANLNGDLTDDPSFAEGEDFAPGKPFAISLGGRNEAAWLSLPPGIAPTSTTTNTAQDSTIEYMDRAYQTAAVALPAKESDEKAAGIQYLLLDSNSDGDMNNPQGSLGVWARQHDGATEVLAVAPPSVPVACLGYRWTLERNLAGGLELHGRTMDVAQRKTMRIGERLPAVRVRTVTGKDLELKAPPKGFLLLYAWSTWYSPCQRDVPFSMNDLSTQFGARGLTMVGLSADYRLDDLMAYLKRNKVAYPQVYNGPDLSAGPLGELGLDRVPQTILVDDTGTVISIGKSGDQLWSYLDEALPKKAATPGKH